MSEVDLLIGETCQKATDVTARRVLSDKLREMEEYDLAKSVEDAKIGENLIIELVRVSKETMLPTSFNLLWAVFNVLPRVKTSPFQEDLLAAERYIGIGGGEIPLIPMWNAVDEQPTVDDSQTVSSRSVGYFPNDTPRTMDRLRRLLDLPWIIPNDDDQK